MIAMPSFIIWPYLSSAEAFVTNEFKPVAANTNGVEDGVSEVLKVDSLVRRHF